MTVAARRRRRDQLDALIYSDGQRAAHSARQLLADPAATEDDRALPWTVIGRVMFGLGHHRRSSKAMRQALAHAAGGVDPDQRISTTISAAAVFAEIGEVDVAESLLVEVEGNASGVLLSRALAQHGYVLGHRGRHRQAMEMLHRAEREALAAGDRLGGLRILVNRSVAAMQSGQFGAALDDLHVAERVATELQQNEVLAGIAGNIGVVEARLGRLADALHSFDVALTRLPVGAQRGRIGSVIELDRAEALERLGEWDAALAAAEHARQFAVASGSDVALGDAELAIARTHLAAGRTVEGHLAAQRAVATLRVARPASALLARAMVLQASLLRTRSSIAALVGRAVRLDRRLRAAGHGDHADRLLSACWSAAWRTADGEMVGKIPDPAGSRSEHAEVIRRALDGQHAAALAIAASAGQGERSAPADGDASAAAELAAVATDVALTAGRTDDVLRWAQFPDRTPLSRAALGRRLGSVTWLRLVEANGELWCVVVRGRRQHLVHVGPVEPIEAAAHSLLDAVTAAAHGESLDVARRSARAADVDRLLFAPLDVAADEVLLITPQISVRNVAWSALPTLADRSFALIPGSLAWLDGSPLQRTLCNRATVMTGPGISAAATERRSIGVYRSATAIGGRRATRAAAQQVVGQPGIVQIAAHGDIRPDRPGRSALELADGPLSVLDLRATDVSADVIMLTCCSLGAAPAFGRDALSLAGTLVRRGAGSVIAPIAPVDERAAARWAVDVHRRIAAGEPVGTALADVRRQWLASDDGRRWSAAAAFVLSGSPLTRLSPSSLSPAARQVVSE